MTQKCAYDTVKKDDNIKKIINFDLSLWTELTISDTNSNLECEKHNTNFKASNFL